MVVAIVRVVAVVDGAQQARDSAAASGQDGTGEQDEDLLPGRLGEDEAKLDQDAYDGQWQAHGFRASRGRSSEKPHPTEATGAWARHQPQLCPQKRRKSSSYPKYASNRPVVQLATLESVKNPGARRKPSDSIEFTYRCPIALIRIWEY